MPPFEELATRAPKTCKEQTEKQASLGLLSNQLQ